MRTTHLTDTYPYWWVDDGEVYVERFARDAHEAYPRARRELDPVSVLALLSFQHLALDRTMVRGLRRLPWLSELDADGNLRFYEAPSHGQRLGSSAEIARRFLDAAIDELRTVVASGEDVYVLLSGGMDSRVMAGILARLQRDGELTAPVHAVTWGMAGTRDVLYAQRLAEKFGWAWTHAAIDADNYWDNFEIAAIDGGAEFDPKHLHRMAWFRKIEKPSIVLAASYGDMVGRAEVSSVHLTSVRELQPRDRNRLLLPSVREEAARQLAIDIAAPRQRHGARSEIGHIEIGRLLHYMRRMLQQPMTTIAQAGHTLHQAFTSPGVFGIMWEYHPELRRDHVYTEVLRLLDPTLLDLAWARTGARYDSGEGTDEALKQHHRYGYWLRSQHAERIGQLLFAPTLAELAIFDVDQVRWMFDEWRRERAEDDTELCTQLSMLATIARFADAFDVQPPRLSPGSPDHVGRLTSRFSAVGRRLSRPLRMKLLHR